MRNGTAASLLVVAVLAGAGMAYVTGHVINERTVTATSTFVSTSTATMVFVSTTTTTSFGRGPVTVANASVPASAWSPGNPLYSSLQCGILHGQAHTAGSGWVTLANAGDEPVNVTGLMIWLGNGNYTAPRYRV